MQRINNETKEKSVPRFFFLMNFLGGPFLKEILNQQNLCKRRDAALAEDCGAWEKRVRDTFIVKAKEGALSPFSFFFWTAYAVLIGS